MHNILVIHKPLTNIFKKKDIKCTQVFLLFSTRLMVAFFENY